MTRPTLDASSPSPYAAFLIDRVNHYRAYLDNTESGARTIGLGMLQQDLYVLLIHEDETRAQALPPWLRNTAKRPAARPAHLLTRLMTRMRSLG